MSKSRNIPGIVALVAVGLVAAGTWHVPLLVLILLLVAVAVFI